LLVSIELVVEEIILMKLEQVISPVNNQLLSDYWVASEKLQPFFQYEYNDHSFKNRAKYLKGKFYDVYELSNIIRSFMEPLGLSEKVEENLSNLENGALAVVGGQQAGILTGPLYSVHKAISVILLAKQQSEKLGINVVPIFWIAGEDHDLEEINHTFTIHNGEVKKRTYSKRSNKKTMASTTPIDHKEMKDLLSIIFRDFGETEHSLKLYHSVLEQMEQSTTFTQFFARLMNSLFQQEGLLLIDAAYGPFRQFESSFFQKIIDCNEEIADLVVAKERLFNEIGYGMPIGATENNANLFFVREGERFLLERNEQMYENASANVKMSKEELLEIAKNNPTSLSNNVVTRPLMQEMTIPVLAFVGGPGELAYWATLKDAFELLDLQMPIFAPRLNITLVTNKVEHLLNEYKLSIDQVWNGQVEALKNQFIESVQDEKAKKQIEQLQQLIHTQYDELQIHLTNQQIHLDDLVEKNKKYHEMQFDYLSKKIEQYVLIQHDKTLRQFNTIHDELFPSENYQERVFNPYQYLNEYGVSLITDILQLPLEITNSHYIVHL